MLKIYNTLSRKKETFTPLHNDTVGMYVCGMTVYSDAHIGHARTYMAFDIVRSYLEWKGYTVTYIQNITDVDDKIIAAAIKENSDPLSYSKKCTTKCLTDLDRLGIKRADLYPKASENIEDMVGMIQKILDKGHGYIADGNVYFSVESFSPYGKLSRQKIKEMQSSGRITSDEKKRRPEDFALWKKQKPGEPFWDSPWGPGRPGWHIECSTMSSKYLGLPFDIHGGGLDLVFPHHENEIAQATAATGKEFAKYWMHVGLLRVDGEKMSKSLGNIINIRDLLQEYNPETIRFFYAQTHYRSPPDFSPAAMAIAQEGLTRITRAREQLQQKARPLKLERNQLSSTEKDYFDAIKKCRNKFEKAMDDDFNTPRAIAAIFDFIKTTNKHLDGEHPGVYQYAYDTLTELGNVLTLFRREKTIDKSIGTQLAKLAEKYVEELNELGNVLTLFPHVKTIDKSIWTQLEKDELMQAILYARNKAREKKEWKTADMIRDELEELGFEIQDTAQGTTWRIK
jgi:cysteinyl-tRNA synthetase